VAVGAEGNQIFGAMIVRFKPRNDVRQFNGQAEAAHGAAVARLG
jgi:hypothetical protein